MSFPQNPANGTTVTIGTKQWSYNATYGVWDKVGGDGSTGPTGPIGPTGPTGATGANGGLDVAIFTVSSSSAIGTGAKVHSLYRLPYDATIQQYDVKVSGTGGFTAATYIAGSDFGLPTTNAITGCSLSITGSTGSSTVFNVSSITAGNFLYLDVFSNASGSTQAQVFLTYERR